MSLEALLRDPAYPLVGATGQYLDSTLALRAHLGGIIVRTETPCLDPVNRNSAPDQRVTNIGDTPPAQERIVFVGAAEKIHGAVDPNTDGQVTYPKINSD